MSVEFACDICGKELDVTHSDPVRGIIWVTPCSCAGEERRYVDDDFVADLEDLLNSAGLSDNLDLAYSAGVMRRALARLGK